MSTRFAYTIHTSIKSKPHDFWRKKNEINIPFERRSHSCVNQIHGKPTLFEINDHFVVFLSCATLVIMLIEKKTLSWLLICNNIYSNFKWFSFSLPLQCNFHSFKMTFQLLKNDLTKINRSNANKEKELDKFLTKILCMLLSVEWIVLIAKIGIVTFNCHILNDLF